MILLRHRIIWQPTDRAPTMRQNTPFLPGLSPVQSKVLTASFDGGRMSSDGGVLVLREIASRLDIQCLLELGRGADHAAATKFPMTRA